MPTEPVSKIYIDGKRIGQMREIVESLFEDSFLSIEVKMPDRIFVIRVDNRADEEKMKRFTEKYRLCRIEVFPMIEFCVFRGKVEEATQKA